MTSDFQNIRAQDLLPNDRIVNPPEFRGTVDKIEFIEFAKGHSVELHRVKKRPRLLGLNQGLVILSRGAVNNVD